MSDAALRARRREYIGQHNATVRARAATARNQAAWAAFFALSPDDETLCSEVQRLAPPNLGLSVRGEVRDGSLGPLSQGDLGTGRTPAAG